MQSHGTWRCRVDASCRIRLWDTPGAAQTPAPLLGQHTDEILSGLLRIPKAKADKLRAAGVV